MGPARCRQVSDFVEELPYDVEGSSMLEMVAAAAAGPHARG